MGISHFPSHQGLSYPSVQSPQGFQAPYLPTPSAPLPTTESFIPPHPVSQEGYKVTQNPWALQIAPGHDSNQPYAKRYTSSFNPYSQSLTPPTGQPNLIPSIHHSEEQPAPAVLTAPHLSGSFPSTEVSLLQYPVSYDVYQSPQHPGALPIAPGQHLNPPNTEQYTSSFNPDSQYLTPLIGESNLISSTHHFQEQPALSVFGDPNLAMPPTMYVNRDTGAFDGGENGAGGSYANDWGWNDPPSPFMR